MSGHDNAPSSDAGADRPGGVGNGDRDGGALRSEVERLRAESEQRQEQYLRARADFDNLKKRSAKEVADRVDGRMESLMLELADLADDFQRALAEENAGGGEEALREGLRAMQRKLAAAFERNGVHPIAAIDADYNQDFHQAISTAPGPLEAILYEVRRGYLIGGYSGRVLRPSQVIVGDGSVVDDAATDEQSKRNADAEERESWPE